jgi:hypothetical protein
VGYVVDREALEQIFSEYFGFPCHSFIPQIASQSSSSLSMAGTVDQKMAPVIVALVPCQPKTTKIKIKISKAPLPSPRMHINSMRPHTCHNCGCNVINNLKR